MARDRSPLREQAFNIYKDNNGNMKPGDIAEILNIKANQVSSWKSIDKWDIELGFKKNKHGAPKGNKNALGNKGGAPVGNFNGFVHGNYMTEERLIEKVEKLLPKAIVTAMRESAGENHIDKAWKNILVLEGFIFGTQKITHIKNKKDMTKELKKVSSGKIKTEEYEIQFAWDKAIKSLDSNSNAMNRLIGMIKTYDEMIHKNWDLATEEQKVRIQVLKSKIINNDKSKEDKVDSYFRVLEDKMKEEVEKGVQS